MVHEYFFINYLYFTYLLPNKYIFSFEKVMKTFEKQIENVKSVRGTEGKRKESYRIAYDDCM